MQTKRAQIRTAAILVIMLAIGTQGAFAQTPKTSETPARVELFGGYSYLRLNAASGGSAGLNGWAADTQVNVNRRFAVAASVNGAYGNQSGADLRLYTFLAGPRLSYRTGRANLFVHALAGAARLGASAAGVEDNATSFAAALGGGVDVKLSRRLAVRVFQTDYLLTKLAENTQHNFRLSSGIVIRLGNTGK